MYETIAVIPAYNEERTIREVMIRCREVKTFPLVVDDASTDNTWNIANSEGIMVLRNYTNKGKGETIRLAFNHIKRYYNTCFSNIKYIVIIDGDLQFNPHEIPNLIGELKNGADYVIGQRNWNCVPFRNMIGNMLWISIFNLIFGTDFKDTNCGFIAMNMNTMRRLKVSSGYIVDNDMLIQAIRMRCRIKNVPVNVHYETGRNLFSGIRMVIGILIFILNKGMEGDK